MAPKEYTCELDGDTQTILRVYLFRNVKNVAEIRENIVKGAWKCAVVNPSLILDPFQVTVAANRAVVSEKQNTMVTRTVFAEILYNLSLTKNITQSLSKFGIAKETNLLVCFLKTPDTDSSEEILPKIEGDLCSISELCNISDLDKIKNVYKLSDVKDVSNSLDIIVSKMVTKNFISH